MGGSVAEVDYSRGTDHTSTRLSYIQPFYRGALRPVKHGLDCRRRAERIRARGGWVGGVKLTLHNDKVENCSRRDFVGKTVDIGN